MKNFFKGKDHYAFSIFYKNYIIRKFIFSNFNKLFSKIDQSKIIYHSIYRFSFIPSYTFIEIFHISSNNKIKFEVKFYYLFQILLT